LAACTPELEAAAGALADAPSEGSEDASPPASAEPPQATVSRRTRQKAQPPATEKKTRLDI
jgi:hypothetical protein